MGKSLANARGSRFSSNRSYSNRYHVQGNIRSSLQSGILMMERGYAYLALPMDVSDLSQLLSGLNSSFMVKIENDAVVIYREEY